MAHLEAQVACNPTPFGIVRGLEIGLQVLLQPVHKPKYPEPPSMVYPEVLSPDTLSPNKRP